MAGSAAHAGRRCADRPDVGEDGGGDLLLGLLGEVDEHAVEEARAAPVVDGADEREVQRLLRRRGVAATLLVLVGGVERGGELGRRHHEGEAGRRARGGDLGRLLRQRPHAELEAARRDAVLRSRVRAERGERLKEPRLGELRRPVRPGVQAAAGGLGLRDGEERRGTLERGGAVERAEREGEAGHVLLG